MSTGSGERSSRPFDATLKHLLAADPIGWLRLLGLPTGGPARVVDADLATIQAAADKVIHVEGPPPWLAHLEFQASRDRTLPERMLQYNVLLRRRHGLPVASVALLLRAEADGPELSGAVRWEQPDGSVYLEFRHRVVRVWQQPVEAVLRGGLGTLPLAPVCDVPPAELPAVIRRMDERLKREAAPGEAATLWAATYWLLGLRYQPEAARQLLRGVQGMRESTTYQATLEEGRVEGRAEGRAEGEARGRAEEARRILLRLGRMKFGMPDRRVSATVGRISNVDRLEQLTDRVLTAASWDELLSGD